MYTRQTLKELNKMMKKTIGRALLSLALMIFALGAWAVPCVTPGDPIDCEIDSPLDAQVWILVAVAMVFAAGYLRSRMPKMA